MSGQNESRHTLSAEALMRAMFELNHCWPQWWAFRSADITIGDHAIEGLGNRSWHSAVPASTGAFDNRFLLAALNPQPLPPMPIEIAAALEVADRLIELASMVHAVGRWIARPDQHEAEAPARMLADEVPDFCPPFPTLKIRVRPFPWPGPVPVPGPGPDPDPVIIKLTPLAQLAMGARFSAAGHAAGAGALGKGLKAAGDKLTRSGLANFDAVQN